MKRSTLRHVFAFTILSATVSSCSAIEGIFKAGMGFGIFIVIVMLAIIAFFIFRATKK